MEKIIKILENKIKKSFSKEGSGHDIYHLRRVLNSALQLQKKEGGDKLVIAIAAFLHDLHRIIERDTGKFCAPKESLPKVRELLKDLKLSVAQKDKILHCIAYHEEYGFSKKGKTVSDIETLIIQDADNLDAMGAIGIGRTFSFSGAHSISMWIPEKPFKRRYFDENKKDISTIHHFHSKLLKLKENMNTKTGKAVAKQRHEFMERFLKEFFSEWRGEK